MSTWPQKFTCNCSEDLGSSLYELLVLAAELSAPGISLICVNGRRSITGALEPLRGLRGLLGLRDTGAMPDLAQWPGLYHCPG